MSIRRVYKSLLENYGPQSWWPSDSPFETMVGAILTQNTTWTHVEKAINNLKANKALTPETILYRDEAQIAAWIKPSGYYNVKTRRLRALCAWLVESGGEEAIAKMPTPALREALLGVKGVGPETCDDILLYALNRPVFVIDNYTRRIFSRLDLIDGGESYDELQALFEQAMGDDRDVFSEYHALIVIHAKEVCRKKPACHACCFATSCPGRI